MSHTPHDLHEEFPEHAAKLHELKLSNAHFNGLAERYHEVNRAIHRAETNLEPVDTLTEEKMRKVRLMLKDQIHAMLTA
jgi:uncharacterized protein YdcH (DUF465 family)